MSNQAPRAPRNHPHGPHGPHGHHQVQAQLHPPKSDEDTALEQLHAKLGAQNLQFGIFQQQVTSQFNALIQNHNALVQANKSLQQENQLLRDEVARLGDEAAHQRAELANLRTEVHAAAGERQEEILRVGTIMQGQIGALWTEVQKVGQQTHSELFGWLSALEPK